MFKRILIPTDGSPLATKAAAAGIKLAQTVGANVTAYCSVPTLRDLYGDEIGRDPVLLRLNKEAIAVGNHHISLIERMARKAGVKFQRHLDGVQPTYIGIIGAAKRANCDLIFMASQGRSGLRRVILGSVAAQVINHSRVPVLVYRTGRRTA